MLVVGEGYDGVPYAFPPVGDGDVPGAIGLLEAGTATGPTSLRYFNAAGATIDVWKAWLTGRGLASKPAW